jgi:Zn-dependent peptidase ImmA (M78 family)
MVMDEFEAVLIARKLVKDVNPTAVPVPVEEYATKIGAKIRLENDLGQDEAGWSFEKGGKHYICVNANDQEERIRFTICHEIGHIVLCLPSDDKTLPWWSYTKRSKNEIICDVFAAELLLPHLLFKPAADTEVIGFGTVSDLASRFMASLTATSSRFATVVSAPCAFVLSEQGRVRYTSRSKTLREANAWIPTRESFPRGSVSERVRSGIVCDGPEEIDADLWFSNWERGGVLLEEARHLNRWDQTLTLLWFEDEEVPQPEYSEEVEEEYGLKELDGILPWPGKKRRK